MQRTRADLTSETGTKLAEPRFKRRVLTGPRATIIAALILTAATLLSLSGRAEPRAKRHSEPPPSVSITFPPNDGRIREFVTVSGTTFNLRPHQVIWVFVQYIHPRSGQPSGNIYPQVGPCSISGAAWACNKVKVGAAKDYGKQFFVWAIIVTDTQASYFANIIVPHSARTWISPANPENPIPSRYKSAIAKIQVQRCLRRQICPN